MADRSTLLLVDDSGLPPDWRPGTAAGADVQILEARDRDEALSAIRRTLVDVVVLRARGTAQPTGDLLAFIEEIRAASPPTLIVVSGCGPDEADISRAIEAGAAEVVPAPVKPLMLELAVARALDRRQLESENRRLRSESLPTLEAAVIRGSSAAIQRVRSAIEALSDSAVPVLIRGERGTGGELVARAIHFAGGRRNRPFVQIDCAAFPARLLHVELFGAPHDDSPESHAPIAGRLARAAGGTLHLVEPQCLPAEIQEALLRRLQAVRRRPPRGGEPAHEDVRIVVTTSADLAREQRDGRVRRDFARFLGAAVIDLPPLRDRREDLPLLAEHLLDRFCRENGMRRKHFTRDAIECLAAHTWPGNLRELDNVVESAALLCREESIGARQLPRAIQERRPAPMPPVVTLPPGGVVLQKRVAEYERALIASAIDQSGGSKHAAALLLGLNRDQMKYLCRKHNL